MAVYENPFSFNGVNLYEFLPHPRIERPLSSSVEVNSVSMPGQPGESYVSAQYQPMEVTVTGNLPVWDVADVPEMVDRLVTVLSPVDREQWFEKVLYLPDRPGRWWKATCVRKEIGRESRRPPVSLTFRMSNPVAYGESKQISFGSGTNVINVGGTYQTYPSRITGTGGTTFVVSNYDHKLQPYSSDGQLSGEVAFYPSEMRATVGGTETAITLDSDYWALLPGKNVITANSAGTINYYERWQ